MPENPRRILHIASLANGGIQAWYMNIYRNLDRRKYQFDFLTTQEDEGCYGSEVKELGGKIYCVPLKDRSIISMAVWMRKAYKYFRNHPEYKIIHCHISDSFAATKAIPARLAGIEHVIIHSRSSSLQKKLRQRIVRQLMPLIGTEFWALTQTSARSIFPDTITKHDKYKISGHLCDLELFRYNPDIRNRIRNELELGSNFVIGIVARFVPVKNHKFLLEVFNLILQKIDCATLLLIGWGPIENEIRTKAKNLGISNHIIFLGEVPQKEVCKYYQAMDVFVLPSLHEGFAAVVLEAQASGLPCIISDTVPNDCKFTNLVTFCPLDEEKWCSEIINCKNIPHRDTYEEMTDLSINAKKYAKSIESAYSEILKGKKYKKNGKKTKHS